MLDLLQLPLCPLGWVFAKQVQRVEADVSKNVGVALLLLKIAGDLLHHSSSSQPSQQKYGQLSLLQSTIHQRWSSASRLDELVRQIQNAGQKRLNLLSEWESHGSQHRRSPMLQFCGSAEVLVPAQLQRVPAKQTSGVKPNVADKGAV